MNEIISFLDIPQTQPYAGLYLDPGTADTQIKGWPVHNHFHFYKDRIMAYPGWKKFTGPAPCELLPAPVLRTEGTITCP